MKIRIYIICLLIPLPFIGHAGLTQNPRDLTRYDDGGAFDGRQMMPKLRRFLWEHWTQKRLAHVVVTLYSIEGDPTTYNLFIEPDRGLLAVARRDKSEFNPILTWLMLALGLDCPINASFPEVFKATTRRRKVGLR